MCHDGPPTHFTLPFYVTDSSVTDGPAALYADAHTVCFGIARKIPLMRSSRRHLLVVQVLLLQQSTQPTVLGVHVTPVCSRSA